MRALQRNEIKAHGIELRDPYKNQLNKKPTP